MSPISTLLSVFVLLWSAFAHGMMVTAELNPELAAPFLQIACKVTGGECPALPRVYFAPLPAQPPFKIYGMYLHGTNFVLLDNVCFKGDVKCQGVLVHEMVHYVVDKQGRYVGNECANEQLAWAAYNLYVEAANRYDLVNLDWRKAYPQCQSR